MLTWHGCVCHRVVRWAKVSSSSYSLPLWSFLFVLIVMDAGVKQEKVDLILFDVLYHMHKDRN